MKLWQKILVCIVAVNLLGTIGVFFMIGSMETWYVELERPIGVPPNWLFGPVWTILYIMIGLSVALFWHRVSDVSEKWTALNWFYAQMLLNIIWMPLFFGEHQLGLAFGVILVLWCCILVTIILFQNRDKVAARLLIPYLCWVSYASYLSGGFWWLNH